MKSIALFDKHSVNVNQNRGHILPNNNMRVNEVRAGIKGKGEIGIPVVEDSQIGGKTKKMLDFYLRMWYYIKVAR